MIAQALEKVGKDGIVTVEEGRGIEFSIDYKEGMEFDKGYASPYFVTNPDAMNAEMEDPYILITDKKITLDELLKFLEKFVKEAKNLVIIADDYDDQALALLVVNKLKGGFNSLAVKAPGFGDRRKAMIEDMAVLTGATVISDDKGMKLETATAQDCGRADKVVANNESTQIIGGRGDKKLAIARIDQLKREISKSTSDFDKEKLQERLAKLSGGVAVINVGAATEIEMKEKKERVIDAVAATKAALEEGIVPGGGVTLLKARQSLPALKESIKIEDEKLGVDIIFQALEAPLRRIAKNAGADDGWVLRTVEEGSKDPKKSDFGFNANTLEFESMLAAGVIDPAKVTRSAVVNAASVGMMVLTTEALVTDLPEKDKPMMPGGGMPGMGGMDY